jgi:hypothetical protein
LDNNFSEFVQETFHILGARVAQLAQIFHKHHIFCKTAAGGGSKCASSWSANDVFVTLLYIKTGEICELGLLP